MSVRTCVSKSGFLYGVHKPKFKVRNLRENDFIGPLGILNGKSHDNSVNFPKGDVEENSADWIYEIPNPFPFRGTTYITKSWAEDKAIDPKKILLKKSSGKSLFKWLGENTKDIDREKICELPQSVLLTLAMASEDPEELVFLAEISCDFVFEEGKPVGLKYDKTGKGPRAVIKNHDLFEAVVNNIHLPDSYKEVMVLRPGVQGNSEIVGEWNKDESHIFEYLRRNSYIPWGHYAANMANDSVRYSIRNLSLDDITGLRHLYYQRTLLRVAEEIGIDLPKRRKTVDKNDLEKLRCEIIKALGSKQELTFSSTLWGWNFGFDYSGTGYRLHASHQQIHQQFAMVPSYVETLGTSEKLVPYSCGDLVNDFVCAYRKEHGRSFFKDYINAVKTNKRMDDRDKNSDLVIFEDENVILFVPKAQTSQWEIKLMTTSCVGNIIEADLNVHKSLDKGILLAMKALTRAGAKMISTIEFSKRFDITEKDQHLFYSFLPKLPYSMGAFSEAQLRWINGHYPEDFAYILREQIKEEL